ncbi:Fpg/Nei family DNA glycosylase [Heyndrickxia oleronia]|uniref:Formamidopyrimidine-DNA glycosylase n=1 Tax=Heyndrickxia oleronia TaxID=38875 RepID=A0A8E2I544_9BACI|nr:DNA-formamidopyrimidine glycosylase family protein [Heyndrickxia oleronia]MCM3453846.1 Fpg/Nei family DNA glycosylase [Heyndrickxia oleronia]MEC1374301.1 DNA-formamidopyrimidine glycosylase family protein [Heyndrickxia oleronia]OOP66240.1 endonuclease VIII [Heyndrickxia oleronia]QQZ07112.1 Fpg/Nei family DNA glycosylase [Heyndrickxia oleronia]
MPELPEMETYKKLLYEKIVGKTITNIIINREKSINCRPDMFIKDILLQKVIRIDRRGKHLLFYLVNGRVLILHLMLGGWMYYGTEEEKPNRTIQIQLSFGIENLYFIGLRLGYLHLYPINEVDEALPNLGPEPLDINFTLPFFINYLHKKRGRLKTKLIDQKFLSGIGNCYSDEICYHAQLLPTRTLEDLTDIDKKQLYESIQLILRKAIQYGGYMNHAFYHDDRLTGGFDNKCKVYDREGELCERCGSEIIKKMISSRKTFYCPHCQF